MRVSRRETNFGDEGRKTLSGDLVAVEAFNAILTRSTGSCFNFFCSFLPKSGIENALREIGSMPKGMI
jgi:hypothetical protein